MSLKSFDKFCETMITGETGTQKEIYDERQNQIRSKLTIETLAVALALSAAIVLLNDLSGWFESSFAAMAMCGAISFQWYVIRNTVKGTLCGVKGNEVKFNGCLIAGECVYFILISLTDMEYFGFLKDGCLSNYFIMIIALGLMLISSTVMLIVAIKSGKNKQNDK